MRYYIDEDGKFRTRRINALEALYYKGKKYHRYKVVCPECGGMSLAFVKSLKDDIKCPHCGSMVSVDVLGDEEIEFLDGDDP